MAFAIANTTENRAEPRSGHEGQRAPLEPEDPISVVEAKEKFANLITELTGKIRYEIQEQTMSPEEQIRALMGTG